METKPQPAASTSKQEGESALKRRRRSSESDTKASYGDGSLPGYKPRSHMTRYSGSNLEDRDDWLAKLQTTLQRDSIRLDRDGPASVYLQGQAASWYQHTYWPDHKNDASLS